MLQSLYIENYAIIEKIQLNFSDSLNIITGETGAGKSIMLGAISLILGKRADTKILYNSEAKCIVEAIFTELKSETLTFLEEEGFDKDEELIIRREISPSGKSRAFINDTPTTLKHLSKVASGLIDLNRQFELLDIQRAKFQLEMIDVTAGTTKAVGEYQAEYFDFRRLEAELQELKRLDNEAAKEQEFLKFQFNELNLLEIQEGEHQSLESDLKVLAKTEQLGTLSQKTIYSLSEDDPSIIDQLSLLKREWEDLAALNPLYDTIVQSLTNVENEILEVVSLSEEAKERLEVDPSRKNEIEDRLNQINALLNKHRLKSSDELMELHTELEEKLTKYGSREEQIKLLEGKLNKTEKDLRVRAEAISAKRKKVFKKLTDKIHKILGTLSMGSAQIDFQHNYSAPLTSTGIDIVEILFSANKGGKFTSIKQAASGGEMSRLMLAMKSTVAKQMELPTLIFDEIDTGVSGEVALKMGGLMKDLSSKHQVISITHSPQVAARASKHFHVFKEESKKRTFTKIDELDSESRVTELAKMLSGSNPSDSAISNARELLELE